MNQEEIKSASVDSGIQMDIDTQKADEAETLHGFGAPNNEDAPISEKLLRSSSVPDKSAKFREGYLESEKTGNDVVQVDDSEIYILESENQISKAKDEESQDRFGENSRSHVEPTSMSTNSKSHSQSYISEQPNIIAQESQLQDNNSSEMLIGEKISGSSSKILEDSEILAADEKSGETEGFAKVQNAEDYGQRTQELDSRFKDESNSRFQSFASDLTVASSPQQGTAFKIKTKKKVSGPVSKPRM